MNENECEVRPGMACRNGVELELLKKRVEDLEAALKNGQEEDKAFRKIYYADREERIKQDALRDARNEEMKKTLDCVKAWVDEQKAKPAKRWESIVTQIISILVAAVAGAVLAKLGIV